MLILFEAGSLADIVGPAVDDRRLHRQMDLGWLRDGRDRTYRTASASLRYPDEI